MKCNRGMKTLIYNHVVGDMREFCCSSVKIDEIRKYVYIFDNSIFLFGVNISSGIFFIVEIFIQKKKQFITFRKKMMRNGGAFFDR